ncbi:MAG: FAD-dependent oxidoreductase [Lentisphaerae bacterium]|nr:FAD-dependent oxidoreductase [Lentisphaerota bacterium]
MHGKVMALKRELHEFDFCVVGGGMAGLLAAVAAARHGTRVALIQDRPVLGGNASSEIRMHICGAHGKNTRETGILEELLLENHYRNRQANYSIWDSVTYGAGRYQDGLSLFLNCTINACNVEDGRIESVTGWQLTTETWHTIRAGLFADCSGDGILAPLAGAEFRIGREARAEYNECIAPEKADRKTMGMSCLFQAREYDTPQPFIPPHWAYRFTRQEDLPARDIDVRTTNYWWMEIGGEQDSIHDTETLRDELLKIAFGVWDYVKNYSPRRGEMANWALDWQGFLPGKRESRRYLGDHVLSQNDVEAEGRFDDLVAYGGWTMDDHFPAGFYRQPAGTIFHPAPSPYGIPLGSLYSRNIKNLFCAGRCHSATHAAMSSTRVMATTSLMGQAVGTAAAIAVREGMTPRAVREHRIHALQQKLMDDDCWLPRHIRAVPELSRRAQLSCTAGDAEPLRSGTDRPVGDAANSWCGPIGSAITYAFPAETTVRAVRLIFDSDLNRNFKNMPHGYPANADPLAVPDTVTKRFRIDAQAPDGSWRSVFEESNNYQRLVQVPLALRTRGIRLVPETTWGAEQVRIFAFDVR